MSRIRNNTQSRLDGQACLSIGPPPSRHIVAMHLSLILVLISLIMDRLTYTSHKTACGWCGAYCVVSYCYLRSAVDVAGDEVVMKPNVLARIIGCLVNQWMFKRLMTDDWLQSVSGQWSCMNSDRTCLIDGQSPWLVVSWLLCKYYNT